jgi:IS66 Orf2 like protein
LDFRKGMDGHAALIAAELKLEPYSGVIYVFHSKLCTGMEF